MYSQKLIPGYYYHIYNRGNNGENIFMDQENYLYFMRLYVKYIHPIAETFSFVLMKNHFHLLIRIKEFTGKYSIENESLKISKSFSNLFNSYTQGINKQYNRHGSLFEKPFKRKFVNSEKYFTQLIYYIHANPQRHGFVSDFTDYSYSSYKSLISSKSTRLMKGKVIDWFGSKEDFIEFHKKEQSLNKIKDLMIDEKLK